MSKCVFLEDIIESQDGEFLGTDELGYPVYDITPVLVGEYCSHFESVNPNCAECSFKNNKGLNFS